MATTPMTRQTWQRNVLMRVHTSWITPNCYRTTRCITQCRTRSRASLQDPLLVSLASGPTLPLLPCLEVSCIFMTCTLLPVFALFCVFGLPNGFAARTLQPPTEASHRRNSCVCVCVCAYVRAYACMCVCVYVCVCVCVCVCMCV